MKNKKMLLSALLCSSFSSYFFLKLSSQVKSNFMIVLDSTSRYRNYIKCLHIVFFTDNKHHHNYVKFQLGPWGPHKLQKSFLREVTEFRFLTSKCSAHSKCDGGGGMSFNLYYLLPPS